MALWEGLYTSGVLMVCIVLLLKNAAPPDAVMAGGLGLLLAASVVPVEDALAGFSNESLLTVVVLFIVAAGISDTGGLDNLFQNLLGTPRNLVSAQLRVLIPVAAISAVFNNTVGFTQGQLVFAQWSLLNSSFVRLMCCMIMLVLVRCGLICVRLASLE